MKESDVLSCPKCGAPTNGSSCSFCGSLFSVEHKEEPFNPGGVWYVLVNDLVGTRLRLGFQEGDEVSILRKIGEYEETYSTTWRFDRNLQTLTIDAARMEYRSYKETKIKFGEMGYGGGQNAQDNTGISYNFSRTIHPDKPK